MAPPPDSPHGAVSAARTGVVGTAVVGFAFFDSVLIGAPIALLAAFFRPSLVYAAATVAVVLLVIGCCRWIDRHWDDWFSGNGTRIERRLETMRASRLLARPVAWLQRGSDRSYAFAAAVANPILVAALARVIGGQRSESAEWCSGRSPTRFRTWRCGRSSVWHSPAPSAASASERLSDAAGREMRPARFERATSASAGHATGRVGVRQMAQPDSTSCGRPSRAWCGSPSTIDFCARLDVSWTHCCPGWLRCAVNDFPVSHQDSVRICLRYRIGPKSYEFFKQHN